MKTNKTFPNGFTSWVETHHEVVLHIGDITRGSMEEGVVLDRYEAQGIGGMYELAEELTDEFEKAFEGHEWDVDWRDTVEDFLRKKTSK